MKKIKYLLCNMVGVVGVLAAFSLPLSFFNLLAANSPCKTYGYYFPATFVMCQINQLREPKIKE